MDFPKQYCNQLIIMEESDSSCLICLNEIEIFGIGTECNHAPMLCWKCFYIIQAYHNEKVCPYCKTSCQTIQYVEPSLLEEKKITDIKFIKDHKKIKVRSKDKKGETEMMNIHSHYDSQEVKDFIYRSTAPYCYECDKEFRSYTEYKKHVEVVHNNYLCELCLKNRHCVISDLQIYSTKKELMDHLNGRGEDSNVNHQKCQY